MCNMKDGAHSEASKENYNPVPLPRINIFFIYVFYSP